MESLRTVFRLAVMLVALGIGYRAWQAYGPPAAQLKSAALRALDIARSALDGDSKPNDQPAALTVDPRPVAPIVGTLAPTTSPAGRVVQAQALVNANESSAPASITAPALVPPPSRLPAPLPLTGSQTTLESSTAIPTADDAQLRTLYSQLEQLGARGRQLMTWGSGGRLYRFSCQAPLAGAPNVNQHFEAVAGEPQAAVKEVLAKVTAWRTAQGEAPQ